MFIIDKFIQRVRDYPDRIAVKSKKQNYSYQEVQNVANQIASKLDHVGSQRIVPFYLQDTRFVLPTIIGIWLSNRIPMPLVSALKLSEAIARVKEVEWNTLITDFSVDLKNKEILQINLLNKETKFSYEFKPSFNKTAYILSTSGSTGIPKKVFLTEGNIKWILTKLYSLIDVNDKTKFLFSTPYSFDVSLTEILSPVVAGAELVCLPTSPSKSESIRLIPKLIEQEQITHLSLSPSFAEALIDIAGPTVFSKLKFLMVAGESFPISLAKKLRPSIAQGCKVFNLYGTTETTVYATYHQVTGNETKYVPIGNPFHGAKVLVVNKSHQAKTGELYIGGNGLTQGYLLDPIKNDASFVFIQGQRYYKTGDNVTTDSNGELIFLEREDDQVQVNGIRIELGEIQTIVAKISGIKSVIVKFQYGRIYVFYLSDHNKEEQIREKIPTYLNPIIVKVKQFLYTYNRKIDVKAMIDRYYYQAPSNDDERVLDKLQSLLTKYHVNEISQLDSLDLVRFIIEVEHTFSVHINDEQLALLTTAERLADFIKHKKWLKTDDLQVDQQATKAELLNFKILVDNFASQYEQEKITASSTQQSLFLQGKTSFDRVRIALPAINYQEIEKIRKIFIDLTSKIDLLTFAWFQDDQGRLYFQKATNICPITFVSLNGFSKNDLEQVLYAKQGRPIYCLIFNLNRCQLEIVFSHHALDASSSNKFKQLFVDLYQQNSALEEIKPSSYARFMDFIRKTNKNTDMAEAINLIPETEPGLQLAKEDGGVYITKFACPAKTTDQVYTRGIYLLSQAMMQDHEMHKITGKIALNIRNFTGFDANNVIGDIHATLPWQVCEQDSLAHFSNSYKAWLNIYTQGIDYRYCIFNAIGKNLQYLPELDQKWKSMNISLNYIGEVEDVDAIVAEILQLPFKANYVTMVSKNDILYCISYGQLLSKQNYQVKLGDEIVTITTDRRQK